MYTPLVPPRPNIAVQFTSESLPWTIEWTVRMLVALWSLLAVIISCVYIIIMDVV